MAIGEVCSREVVFARTGTSVRAAAQLMRQYHVGTIVVVKEPDGTRIPVGVLTDRDVAIAVVAKALDADLLRVEEVMAPELVVVRETDGISETIDLMRSKGVRRVPVVDQRGALVGIVSADDFIDLLAEELTGLARMIAHEQRREAEARKA